jgi:hypothetical protein
MIILYEGHEERKGTGVCTKTRALIVTLIRLSSLSFLRGLFCPRSEPAEFKQEVQPEGTSLGFHRREHF